MKRKVKEWFNIGIVYLSGYFGIVWASIVDYNLFGILLLGVFLLGIWLAQAALIKEQKLKGEEKPKKLKKGWGRTYGFPEPTQNRGKVKK